MLPTKLLYMTEQNVFRFTAVVLAVVPTEQGDEPSVILDQTLFYPRGGGQESDAGVLTSSAGTFQVRETRFIDGTVHHVGAFSSGHFSVGAEVELEIDQQKRRLNSRLHTAGHIIDEAVRVLNLDWFPTKGIHYFGKAAVEYRNNGGAADNLAALAPKIEAEANRLIQTGFAVIAELMDITNLPQRAHFILPDLPTDKPIRLVTVWGTKGVPCGGTHVANVSDVGLLKIRYVKARKDAIKVAYEIQP